MIGQISARTSFEPASVMEFSFQLASTSMSNEVNAVVNMEEFRRSDDREIEHLTELWRQEECLWKINSKNCIDIHAKKMAMLNIRKQMGGIDTGKDRLHY